MKYFVRLSAVLITLFGVMTSPAAAQQGAAEGPGSVQCSVLTKARADNPDAYREFAVWISGFLSAANAYETDTYDLTPWQPIQLSLGQISRYCGANGEASVAQAMTFYIAYLRPDRLTEPEDKTLITNGANGLRIYPSVLGKVRAALIKEGILTEDAPRAFGPDFIKGIERYQTSKGFQVNGLPDDRTLVSLLNPSR